MSSSCKKIEVVVKAAVGQPDKLGDCKLCTDPVSENSNSQFLQYFLETTFYYHFLPFSLFQTHTVRYGFALGFNCNCSMRL